MQKQLFNRVNKNPSWMTSFRERMDYYLYFCGQNMIYMLVSSYLASYLLMSGVPATKTAGIMLAVKVWDAVNDAIFGCIFDSVHFKSKKKFIPWLKISLPVIPITTILLYMIPGGASETVKLVWFAVAYLLWDTAYTLCDVPIFGMVTAMTEVQDERTSLLSYKSIWSGVGSAFALVLATVLPTYVDSGFTVCAIVIGVAAFLTMLPICRNGKERCVGEADENFTLRKMFRYLFSNKYLLIYYSGFFFYNALNTLTTLSLFVAFFLFNNSLFSLVVSALAVVPAFIFSLLVPRMVKRFGKMPLYWTCSLITVVMSVVMWLIGYGNLILFIALFVIRAIPMSIIGVMMFMFTPDCAEYGIFKTGIDAKGITFAIQTFMVKLTSAIASAASIFVLGLFGWREIEASSFEELKAMGVTQPPEALDGLWFTFMLLPAIGVLLSMILWYFYKLKDNDVELMAKANNGDLPREEAVAGFSPALKKEFTREAHKNQQAK